MNCNDVSASECNEIELVGIPALCEGGSGYMARYGQIC